MLRYLKNKQIDKSLWDKCISESLNGIIYAYSWYLDIICPGWDGIVDDDYTMVMPLCKGEKYFMKYIYPPFFCQQLGVFSRKPITEIDFQHYFKEIPKSFRFIEMNLHITNPWIPPAFTSIKNSDYILNLSAPYDEIRNNYSENHFRNCIKAEKKNLGLFKHANIEMVIDMFVQNKGKSVEKLKQHHYDMFSILVKEALLRKMAHIWSVSDPDGIPCASAVIFESHNNAIFIFSGLTLAGRNLNAMHFLIDQYIRENCMIKKKLDFEGSNDPDLARFYKGFGSEEFVYLQIKKNTLPPPWSWVKK